MACLPAPRSALLLTTTALAMLLPVAASSEDQAPTLNFYGAPGLIDLPSGEAMPDGALTATTAHFGPISRSTLSFQLSPRLSASFRYSGVRDWNEIITSSSFETYYDRSFDLRYQLASEGRYMPGIAVGLQDFVGTGLLSGEYIVATKHLHPSLKVTAGLGWGRLGSYGSIGSPLGDRDPVDVDQGGEVNWGQWFRGPAAPFAGVEWQATDRLSVKAEYSSDDYTLEAGKHKTFERKSPFNFGAEYKLNDSFRLGAYYLYGSEVGFSAQIALNPRQRPTGGVIDGAPDPVKPRPSRAADPEAWSPDWVTQEDAAQILVKKLNKRLNGDGISVEAISYTAGNAVKVHIRNDRYDAEAQAIGRAARAMTQTLPASVETFEIVPVVNGIPLSKVVVRRSDLERLEFSPNAAAEMRSRVEVSEADPVRRGQLTFDPDLYPRLNWGFGPYLRTSLFDPDSPIRAEVGARLAFRFEPVRGQVFSGSFAKPIAGNLDDEKPGPSKPGAPPRVRSNGALYNMEGDPAIEHLTWAWYSHPSPEIHARLTVGYLERMFGGVSGEVLWKRTGSPWAIGAEINYVKQRDFDQLFGFQDYSIVTGHLSGYYEFGQGYHAQLDVGRYLAGDVGATLTLQREFENGWKVGVYATKTDMSAEDFGEGSFDKGIKLTIPFNWALGAPTRRQMDNTLRSLARDGGARLDVEGRLYDNVRSYDTSSMDAQWGRFWK